MVAQANQLPQRRAGSVALSRRRETGQCHLMVGLAGLVAATGPGPFAAAEKGAVDPGLATKVSKIIYCYWFE